MKESLPLFVLLREIVRFKIYAPIRRLVARWRDWKENTETETLVDHSSLDLSRESESYEATPYAHLERILDELQITPGGVFLDLGCGKGRSLLAACRYPFSKVIGVEISGDLCAIARQNLSRLPNGTKCNTVEIICSDAANYVFPDDSTHIYFFNPFSEDIMIQVVSNLFASIKKFPREVIVAYYNPRHAKSLENRFPLSLLREVEFSNLGDRKSTRLNSSHT